MLRKGSQSPLAQGTQKKFPVASQKFFFHFAIVCPKIQDHRIKPQLTFQQFFSAGIFVIRDSIGNKRLILSVCDRQDQTFITYGIEIEGVDTLKIDKLTPDSLVLSSNYGYTLEYVRQK